MSIGGPHEVLPSHAADPGRAASRVRAFRRVTFGRTTFSGSTPQQPTTLRPPLMRLHEETNDHGLRRRVLDVIDDMLRAGFIGMSDRLGQQYDR